MMKECSVQELHKWISENEDLHLIDVREAAEAGIVSIGGTLIPMSEVGHRFNEIPKDKKVIVYCRSGVRSANVIRFLQEQEGFENLMNLKGGILSWIDEIDPSLPSY
jgi:rhodanese-related sulfurtransferase